MLMTNRGVTLSAFSSLSARLCRHRDLSCVGSVGGLGYAPLISIAILDFVYLFVFDW